MQLGNAHPAACWVRGTELTEQEWSSDKNNWWLMDWLLYHGCFFMAIFWWLREPDSRMLKLIVTFLFCFEQLAVLFEVSWLYIPCVKLRRSQYKIPNWYLRLRIQWIARWSQDCVQGTFHVFYCVLQESGSPMEWAFCVEVHGTRILHCSHTLKWVIHSTLSNRFVP